MLISAVALFCWLCFLGFILPADPDESVFKVVARGIVDGRWPYRDLFDNKPPLVYFFYLPTGFGWSIEFERILAAASTATSVMVFAAVAKKWAIGRQRTMAVASYCLFVGNPFLAAGAHPDVAGHVAQELVRVEVPAKTLDVGAVLT